MMTRAIPVLLLLLAGCGGAHSEDGADSRTIACGPEKGPTDKNCTLDVSDEDGTLHLTLRQPEGGFRRLVWPRGGDLAEADGAEPLRAARLPGDGVEARIGGWIYRIEAKGGGLP